jgi:predicted nucleic acid-binding protein
MQRIFVSSSAFVALNDSTNSDHKEAVSFVSGLFNQTVKVYSSVIEIVWATEAIEQKAGKEKALTFSNLVTAVESGITIVPSFVEYLPDSEQYVITGDTVTHYREIMLANTMHAHGIRDVFSFNKRLRDLNVIVWPKK